MHHCKSPSINVKFPSKLSLYKMKQLKIICLNEQHLRFYTIMLILSIPFLFDFKCFKILRLWFKILLLNHHFKYFRILFYLGFETLKLKACYSPLIPENLRKLGCFRCILLNASFHRRCIYCIHAIAKWYIRLMQKFCPL